MIGFCRFSSVYLATVGAELSTKTRVRRALKAGFGVGPQKQDWEIGVGELLLLVWVLEALANLSSMGVTSGAFQQELKHGQELEPSQMLDWL